MLAHRSIRQRKPKHIASQVAFEASNPNRTIRCRISLELTSHHAPNADGPLRVGPIIVSSHFEVFDNKTMPRTGGFKSFPFFGGQFVIAL